MTTAASMDTPHGRLAATPVAVGGHLEWWHAFGTYADGTPQASPLFRRHHEACPACHPTPDPEEAADAVARPAGAGRVPHPRVGGRDVGPGALRDPGRVPAR